MLSTNPITTALIKAREMIADPARWCQGKVRNDDHTQHCAIGAVYEQDLEQPVRLEALNNLRLAAQDLFSVDSAVTVNNTLGHAATLQMFDRAIENSLRGPGS